MKYIIIVLIFLSCFIFWITRATGESQNTDADQVGFSFTAGANGIESHTLHYSWDD